MKVKNRLDLFISLIIILLLYPNSLFSQKNDYNYSIKNRWTVKASVSRYKTAFSGTAFAFVGDNFWTTIQRKMANFKVEANYGINKFIETGVSLGFQHYEWYETNQNTPLIELSSIRKSFAPLFGVNLNFHVLPFFVKSEKSNWDLYLTVKYGGCYLPYKEIEHPLFEYSKYRQEYGLGIGASYYFKNIIGLFMEGSVGNYFYFEKFDLCLFREDTFKYVDFTDSNFSFRIGIAVKI